MRDSSWTVGNRSVTRLGKGWLSLAYDRRHAPMDHVQGAWELLAGLKRISQKNNPPRWAITAVELYLDSMKKQTERFTSLAGWMLQG